MTQSAKKLTFKWGSSMTNTQPPRIPNPQDQQPQSSPPTLSYSNPPPHQSDEQESLTSSHSLDEDRINRMTYIAWNSVLTLAAFIVVGSILLLFFSLNTLEDIMAATSSGGIWAIGLSLGFIYFAFHLTFTARRLHDTNQSGWFSILVLIPILNICLYLYLIFMPGTQQQNNYGSPRSSLKWEIIVGWLAIILFCLDLLSSLLTS